MAASLSLSPFSVLILLRQNGVAVAEAQRTKEARKIFSAEGANTFYCSIWLLWIFVYHPFSLLYHYYYYYLFRYVSFPFLLLFTATGF